MYAYDRRDYEDASEQEGGLRGWRQVYTQLDRGGFRGSIARLDLGPFSLIEETMNVVVEQETSPPEGKLLVIIASKKGRRINGARSADRGFVHVGGNDIRLVAQAENRSFFIMCDPKDVPGLELGSLAPIAALANHKALDGVMDWIAAMLTAAPDLAGYTEADVATLSAMVRDRVVDICNALLSPDNNRPLGNIAARQLVDRARRAADDLAFEPLTVARLADELDIAPHVLREAFVESTGVSTHSWLRYRRLARARRQVLEAPRDGRGVTEIAMENGFLHLGRFAGFYAETFGESPIETIRRRRGEN